MFRFREQLTFGKMWRAFFLEIVTSSTYQWNVLETVIPVFCCGWCLSCFLCDLLCVSSCNVDVLQRVFTSDYFSFCGFRLRLYLSCVPNAFGYAGVHLIRCISLLLITNTQNLWYVTSFLHLFCIPVILLSSVWFIHGCIHYRIITAYSFTPICLTKGVHISWFPIQLAGWFVILGQTSWISWEVDGSTFKFLGVMVLLNKHNL